VNETVLTKSLKSLRDRLHERARELRSAEDSVHMLKLAQLARDREIEQLKSRIADLESEVAGTPAVPQLPPSPPPRPDYRALEQIRAELEMRAEELELQDRIVAAAERERATHMAYIEHLQAQMHADHPDAEPPVSVRAAFQEAARILRAAFTRRAISRTRPQEPPAS